jgi:hypothetical protein
LEIRENCEVIPNTSELFGAQRGHSAMAEEALATWDAAGVAENESPPSEAQRSTKHLRRDAMLLAAWWVPGEDNFFFEVRKRRQPHLAPAAGALGVAFSLFNNRALFFLRRRPLSRRRPSRTAVRRPRASSEAHAAESLRLGRFLPKLEQRSCRLSSTASAR